MKQINSNIFVYCIFISIIIIFFSPFLIYGYPLVSDILIDYFPFKNDFSSNFLQTHLVSDMIDWHLPAYKVFFDSLKQGQFQMWSYYLNLGSPSGLYLLYGFFYPLHILYLFFQPEIAISLVMVIKYSLGLIFAYLFFRELNFSKTTSVISAIIFSFSGFNSVWKWGQTSAIILLAPLSLLLIEKILKSKKSSTTILNLTFFSISIAINLLTGFVAFSGYYFYFFSIYFIFRLISKPINKKFIKLILFFIFFILGILLTSFQLLPTLEKVYESDLSYRSHAVSRKIPRKFIKLIFLPNYYGNPSFNNWTEEKNFSETAQYFGISVFPVILIALIFKQKKTENYYFWLISTVILFLTIYNLNPLNPIITSLPVINTSSLLRLLALLPIIISTLFAFSFQFLITEFIKKYQPNNRNIFNFLLFPTIMLFLFFSVYVILNKSILVSLFSAPLLDLLRIHDYIFSFLSIAFPILLLLCSFFTILLYFYYRKITYIFLLLIIIIFDLYIFNFGTIPFSERKNIYPITPGVDFLIQNIEDPMDKVMLIDNVFMLPGTQTYYGIPSIFNHHLSYQEEKLLFSIYQPEIWRTGTVPLLSSNNLNVDSDWLNLFSVRYLVAPPTSKELTNDYLQLVYSNENEIKIYENKSFFDKYLLFNEVKIIENLNSAANYISSDDFNSTYQVVLHNKEYANLQGCAEDSEIKIFYNTNIITIRYNVDEDCYFVLKGNYNHGWIVTNQNDPIIRANLVLSAVKLYSNNNEISLSYLPNSFIIGVVLSGVTFSILLFLLLNYYFNERSVGEESS